MTMRVAWFLIVLGLALISTGCARPLDVAVASANATAAHLQATHEQLKTSYQDDQLAAARRVKGDRSDPAVKAEQRDRVGQVRADYAPLWEAYGAAHDAWKDLLSVLVGARARQDMGLMPEMAPIADALALVVKTSRLLMVEMARMGLN